MMMDALIFSCPPGMINTGAVGLALYTAFPCTAAAAFAAAGINSLINLIGINIMKQMRDNISLAITTFTFLLTKHIFVICIPKILIGSLTFGFALKTLLIVFAVEIIINKLMRRPLEKFYDSIMPERFFNFVTDIKNPVTKYTVINDYICEFGYGSGSYREEALKEALTAKKKFEMEMKSKEVPVT